MPISGQGWEILIERTHVQRRADGRVRTVGRYQVFHDNVPVTTLAGTTAESPGPGSNEIEGSGKRVAAGRYPLFTHAGPKYVTLNFAASQNQAALPRPALGLEHTGHRSAILIHPGIGFLASRGCINLCTRLPDATEAIDFIGSRHRVIALIDDLADFLGPDFPGGNNQPINRAVAAIDGEPFT